MASKDASEECKKAIRVLLLIREISNQAIGDALADLLLVELSLFGLKWSIREWDAIYEERPGCLTAMRVKDRTIFETTNAEQQVVKPEGLQKIFDAVIGGFENARAFVRPSGTEDVVRVYAEAETPSDANALNLAMRQAVFDNAGGVGDRPTQ